MVLTI